MDTPIISGVDIFVVIVIALCVFRGYRRGLVRALFDLVSNVLAMVVTYMFSGTVAALLRQTPLFGWMQGGIADRLGIGDMVGAGVTNIIGQADVIAGLHLPEQILSLLHENNNPEVFNMLGVTALEDYISGFLASMVLSGISALLVFAAVSIILRQISRGLGFFNRIPIIGGLNRWGGAAGGAVIGTVIVWVVFALAALAPFVDLGIENTVVARYLYENNLLTDFFVNITSRIT